MSGVRTQLLISPSTLKIAAELTEEDGVPQKVVVWDKRLTAELKVTGIVLAQGLAAGRRGYIFPSDDDQALFARAFKEEYFVHGLQQGGYYWVAEADYTGPEGEIDKAKRAVLDSFKKK